MPKENDIIITNDGLSSAQADIDRIVGRRILSERAKFEAEIKKIASDFKQKVYTFDAECKLTKRGYSSVLLTALNANDMDTLKKHLDTIEKAVEARVEDDVNARLRGNVPPMGKPINPEAGVRGAFGLNH